MSLLDILQQYTNAGAPPTSDVAGHFDTVARQANPQDLGQGIAAALRSDATPSFGQTIGSLFGQSNPSQKAGVLNEILQSLGPAALGTAGGGVLGRILGAGSGGGTGFGVGTGSGVGGAIPPVSPEQATQVSPAELSTIAERAQQQNGSIVDRLGAFYAQHPTLVKTLGAAALGAVMSHMNSQRRA